MGKKRRYAYIVIETFDNKQFICAAFDRRHLAEKYIRTFAVKDKSGARLDLHVIRMNAFEDKLSEGLEPYTVTLNANGESFFDTPEKSARRLDWFYLVGSEHIEGSLVRNARLLPIVHIINPSSEAKIETYHVRIWAKNPDDAIRLAKKELFKYKHELDADGSWIRDAEEEKESGVLLNSSEIR